MHKPYLEKIKCNLNAQNNVVDEREHMFYIIKRKHSTTFQMEWGIIFCLRVFSRLRELWRDIVDLLCGSSNQRSAVTCKGDIPFPFQVQNELSVLYVRRCLYAGD